MDKPQEIKPQAIGMGGSITITMSGAGDIGIRVQGTWPPPMMMAAAGMLSYTAGQMLDQQQLAQAMLANPVPKM